MLYNGFMDIDDLIGILYDLKREYGNIGVVVSEHCCQPRVEVVEGGGYGKRVKIYSGLEGCLSGLLNKRYEEEQGKQREELARLGVVVKS